PSELMILGKNGKAHENQEGEILVKGPNVTSGYYRREEANAKSFDSGWFHPADLGYVDEEGFLFVLDRRSDLIISGGENVYPAEIESV
ncbi:AMP-binding protein, partial [Planococcus sp. SIMBA_143]